MVKCYAQEKRVFDINKVTVVGSPSISEDGVASGFSSSSNYIGLPNSITLGKGKSWDVQWQGKIPTVTTGNFITNSFTVGRLNTFGALSALLYLYNPDTQSFSNLQINLHELGSDFVGKAYKASIKYDGVSSYTFTIKLENGTERTASAMSTSYFNQIALRLGGGTLDTTFDLTAFKIYVDGELVYSPTKPICYLERRKEGFDLSKFTVVGTPTITEDGVYTCGNDKASYVKVPFDNTLDSFSLDVEINIQNSSQSGYYLGHSNNITYGFIDANFNGTGATDFRIKVKDNDGNISTLSMGAVKYQVGINKINLIFTGTYYLLTRTEANGTITTSKLETTNKPATNFFSLGNSNKADVALTTIDLTKITVTVDGKEVFTGAKEKFYAMQGGM